MSGAGVPIDSCITQHKAQGPSRTWNERTEEEYEDAPRSLLSREARTRDGKGLGYRVEGL